MSAPTPRSSLPDLAPQGHVPPDSVWAKVRMVLPFVIGIAIAGVLDQLLPLIIGPFYSRIVLDMGIAMILAVSLNIVNGMTGQFSIGHAGFMTLGGYTAAMLSFYGSMWLWGTRAEQSGLISGGLCLYVLACLAGGLMAAAAGYVVGLPSLRLRGDYLAIVTLGFGEILRVILQNTGDVITNVESFRSATWSQFLPPPVGGAIGFAGIPKYTTLFWVYTFLTLTVVLAYRLKQSSLGRAMISIREDEIASQAMGVNIARNKVLAFVLAAFFAGVAGGLFAHEKGVIISPRDAGFQRSFDIVIMTVLGGRGSITGVMLAAIILTALPELLRDFEQYRLIMYALLLIIMMIVRPQGLFGIHEVWHLMWGRRTRQKAA